jgi:hypothetical protein
MTTPSDTSSDARVGEDAAGMPFEEGVLPVGGREARAERIRTAAAEIERARLAITGGTSSRSRVVPDSAEGVWPRPFDDPAFLLKDV